MVPKLRKDKDMKKLRSYKLKQPLDALPAGLTKTEKPSGLVVSVLTFKDGSQVWQYDYSEARY